MDCKLLYISGDLGKLTWCLRPGIFCNDGRGRHGCSGCAREDV